MIFFTYAMSGLLLAITGYLFMRGVLSVETQTIAWMIVFFFASTAASSAYLTVSETFPLEIRALAIAIFYAIGTGIGGVAGPLIFGALIDTGSRVSVFGGYIFASVLMIGGGAGRADAMASMPSASRWSTSRVRSRSWTKKQAPRRRSPATAPKLAGSAAHPAGHRSASRPNIQSARPAARSAQE